MTAIPLPALDGRTLLGFLAAVGVLRLMDEQVEDDLRLSWSPESATAVLHAGCFADPQGIAAALTDVVASIGDGQVIPGVPADLPPPGEAPDRLRLSRVGFRPLVEALRRAAEDTVTVDAWVASLVTDLCLDERGRVAISLFAAPSGKQSMRTMLEKPLALIRGSPELLLDALVDWRRVSGYTGEYLDHRVLFDAADAPDGKSSERGVPGATWLALMAYPLFRTTSLDGSGPLSTGWSRENRRLVLRWPLWRQPLDIVAVRTLLDHPAVVDQARIDRGASFGHLATLGVFYMGRAARRRIAGRTFAGVMAPIPTAEDQHVKAYTRGT